MSEAFLDTLRAAAEACEAAEAEFRRASQARLAALTAARIEAYRRYHLLRGMAEAAAAAPETADAAADFALAETGWSEADIAYPEGARPAPAGGRSPAGGRCGRRFRPVRGLVPRPLRFRVPRSLGPRSRVPAGHRFLKKRFNAEAAEVSRRTLRLSGFSAVSAHPLRTRR
jgi:hypothetical protein